MSDNFMCDNCRINRPGGHIEAIVACQACFGYTNEGGEMTEADRATMAANTTEAIRRHERLRQLGIFP